jgi:hypothetical protein
VVSVVLAVAVTVVLVIAIDIGAGRAGDSCRSRALAARFPG